MSKREQEFADWKADRDREVVERGRRPLTERHHHYLSTIESSPLTIALGPAGTGKTTLAISVAANLLKSRQVERIVLCRPLVECGEKLGTLPGDVNEKMSLFVKPMTEALRSHFHDHEIESMRAKEKLLIIPLAQMRGLTLNRSFVCLDEAQNATYGQLHMFLTRQGDGSRFVVNGDIRQSDIASRAGVPLLQATRRLAAPPRRADISFVLFRPEDVLRPDIVSFCDQRLAEDEREHVAELAHVPPPRYGDWAAMPN